MPLSSLLRLLPMGLMGIALLSVLFPDIRLVIAVVIPIAIMAGLGLLAALPKRMPIFVAIILLINMYWDTMPNGTSALYMLRAKLFGDMGETDWWSFAYIFLVSHAVGLDCYVRIRNRLERHLGKRGDTS